MRATRARKPALVDRRLLGTWRSDGPRTVAEWRFRKRLSPDLRRRFLGIFGRLEMTYTRSWVRGVLDDYRYRCRYEVLGVDADSVAIRVPDGDGTGTWVIQHLHFAGDALWIDLGGNREWFLRVPASLPRGRGRDQRVKPVQERE